VRRCTLGRGRFALRYRRRRIQGVVFDAVGRVTSVTRIDEQRQSELLRYTLRKDEKLLRKTILRDTLGDTLSHGRQWNVVSGVDEAKLR
jgi:hypothetical protein